jgi:hypothetical protein
MEEISRSVRQAKQAKFWDVDCTCPYSPYDDDVVHIGWLFFGELGEDTCPTGK